MFSVADSFSCTLTGYPVATLIPVQVCDARMFLIALRPDQYFSPSFHIFTFAFASLAHQHIG